MVDGTFQLKLIPLPFKLVFVAVIVGAEGTVVSIVNVELVPTFDVFEKLSNAYSV